jgi:cytochrome c biogenesis protein CcmG/thiol:disulfide interchange protein DsbE
MAVKPLVLLPPAIFALLAGLFAAGMFRDDPEALPSALEGQPAPPLVLTKLGPGEPFTDADLRSGGVKLVNYWASWCAPCRIEHPVLMEIEASGIPVYGINYKDDPEKALGFLAELGDPYAAIGADASGRTALDWGVYGVPETYVIDASGTIRLRFAGPVTREIYEKRILPAIEAAEGG